MTLRTNQGGLGDSHSAPILGPLAPPRRRSTRCRVDSLRQGAGGAGSGVGSAPPGPERTGKPARLLDVVVAERASILAGYAPRRLP